MLAPSGAKARFQANVAAIRLVRTLAEQDRPANAEEQQILARWSSWGAIPDVFDASKTSWANERDELRELLSDDEWQAAARTTLNAHYTDPGIATEMWRAVRSLGFHGGTVLEPGSGLGTFIGLAPETAQTTGIELDPLTAQISRALYPQAQVRSESFADTHLPEASFDVTIGNVPFSDVALHDRVYNPDRRHSMHNHFILKSLALTRPGGMVAVLASRFTMDSQNPGARREMNLMADLVGAVRLPTGAHRRTAGTDVVTDLLLLRRRADDEPARNDLWETVTPVSLDGHTVRINRYFDEHPEHVLGRLETRTGQFGQDDLTVVGDLGRLSEDLHNVVDQITFTARRTGTTMTEAPQGREFRPVAARPAPPSRWDGSIIETDTGFGSVVEGGIQELQVPKSASVELRALLGLRDGASTLLEAEASTTEDTAEITQAREQLRRDYQRYVGRYGPLNRFTLRRTGRVNDAGEDTHARIVPRAIRILRGDPFGPLVMALENYDDTEQTATPAEILDHRVVSARREIQGVETPADAVAVSLDRTGGIDPVLVADMLGMDETEARAALTGLVFTDPATDELVHAPAYLSGNVREKLDIARARAEEEPEFQTNVDALAEVLPEPLGVEDITARLGAVWISADVHQQFLRELLRDSDVLVENAMPGMWEVRGGRHGLLATSEWGTERRPASDIAQALMEQKTLLVYDEVRDAQGRRRPVLNQVETVAAQEKAERLQERFGEWVWEAPDRAKALVEEYNRRFNSIVLRDYSNAGDYLTLPGLSETFTPRPHQRAAVARMVAEPACGLFHEVGAGKTASFVMGAMEMRRMGLVRKPVVVIPNHMLEQVGREWLQLYPRARILAASSQDLTADRRRGFIARAAANDWDAIVLTQSAFAKIPLRAETERAYLKARTQEVRHALEQATGEDAKSVKRIERKLLGLENRLKGRIDSDRDQGVSFEDTGIDYVIVDEAHMYKNLSTESNIGDAQIEGSARASDLHLKLEYLRSKGRERVVTAATATPIANSITEAHVMQRYLRPDLLRAAKVEVFDAWAATFGKTVTEMEMSPTGSTFRMKTRFARFSNVPEMLRLWSTFADVKTADDLKLPTPLIAEREDGQRAAATRPVPPTIELEEFIARLGKRAEAVASRAVKPTEDNMLLISTDGRKAALDIRMVLPNDPSGPTKIDAAAEMIYRTWQATKDTEYLDPTTGQPSPVTGSLQLVFSDIGTPNPHRWNAYDELASQLILRGMPGEAVRFMHEAKNDTEKARLFAAARAGHVAVLIGSTEKMGVGTNIQNRAVALYHLDCPWRPADIAQREGRILRQGNQNPEVAIVRLVTERSFDSYMWQGVERKARFISQIMHGSLDAREIEEIDSASLSAAEAKAISSGNPLLLEHATIQNEVTRLHRLERAHGRSQAMLAHTRDQARSDAERARQDIAGLETILPQVTDTSGDKFRIAIAGRTYDSRNEAAAALAGWAETSNLKWAPRYAPRDFGTVGTISGFDFTVATDPALGDEPYVKITLPEVPRGSFSVSRATFLDGGIGLIQRIENRLSAVPDLLEHVHRDLNDAEEAEAEASNRIGEPFRHAEALATAEADLSRIETALAAMPTDNTKPSAIPDTTGELVSSASDRGLTVEAVRDHRAALGVRADPERTPAQLSPGSTLDRNGPARGL